MNQDATSCLPFAWGGPLGRAIVRHMPEDFHVEEIPSFPLDGTGEHVFLQIRKRNRNTEEVARELAKFCQVGNEAVGFAGLKDKHAVTVQWFSVQLPGKGPEPDWNQLVSADLQILANQRHRKKLRRGVLVGNRFRILLRDCHLLADNGIEERLQHLRTHGVPNYFGEQRFGAEGGNLRQAELLFSGKLRKCSRHQRGLYLSAVRAHLFNAVLAQRVKASDWCDLRLGDVAQLHGSHSFFLVQAMDDTLRARLAAHDVHPTGPLWGQGTLPTQGETLAQESALTQQFALYCQGLADAGLNQERRPLRLSVAELAWQWPSPDQLELHFALPAGGYATTVLRELVETGEA